MNPRPLKLGEVVDTDKPYHMDPDTRWLHMHIIGSTGAGKSKFIEYLIRSDIVAGNGLCLIDPHGHLYNDIVNWCAFKKLNQAEPDKILLFEPSADDWTFGFNPLKTDSPDISFHVDAMVRAVSKVWGGEDQDKTPRLKRCLCILFHALTEKKLSLLEASYLLNPAAELVREHLTYDIQDLIIKQEWDYFNVLRPKEFSEFFESTRNHIIEFLYSPIIRSIIGQLEDTIDFRQIMDQGQVLLINLAADKISSDSARLLGTLIVNDLFMKAKDRTVGSRPFYAYIDECALFINDDISRILDEGRKFGLSLILAHQHLDQLKKAGEDVYQAVLINTATKVIFGGLSVEDAETLAGQIWLSELNQEKLDSFLNKIVKEKQVWTFDHTETSSESPPGPEALNPIIEERPESRYSLEEQIYKAMALMVNQPTGQAVVKQPEQQPPKFIKTPFVEEPIIKDEELREFKERCYQSSYFAQPRAEAEKQIEERQSALLKAAQEKPPHKSV